MTDKWVPHPRRAFVFAPRVGVHEPTPAQNQGQEKLAIVIPSLREAENLPRLLRRVGATLSNLEIPCEILVVDDDSRDGTREIVSAFAREDTRVRLLVRLGERGLSGAILHGWQHTDATILGVMDADGQHPPELLPNLLATIAAGHDLAIGSRYTSAGSRGAWNPFRWLISSAAICAARPLQPRCLSVRDPLSGFFLVRRRCVENLPFQPTGFKLLLEILVRGRVRSLEELPFVFGRRGAGRSKVSLRVAWDYLALLARLYSARFKGTRIQQAPSGN
jgi:dolichol-phosphate mannosyltransferase